MASLYRYALLEIIESILEGLLFIVSLFYCECCYEVGALTFGCIVFYWR